MSKNGNIVTIQKMGNKGKILLLGITILIVIGGILVFRKSSNNTSLPTTEPPATMNVVEELKIEDLVVGTGIEAVAGKSVTVNYSGTLVDGTKFDSSYDRGTPFTFNLGAGEVIQGWDKGIAGMKVGGKRKLTIPPNLGYGAQGAGSTIPPNATLIFEVELLKIE